MASRSARAPQPSFRTQLSVLEKTIVGMTSKELKQQKRSSPSENTEAEEKLLSRGRLGAKLSLTDARSGCDGDDFTSSILRQLHFNCQERPHSSSTSHRQLCCNLSRHLTLFVSQHSFTFTVGMGMYVT